MKSLLFFLILIIGFGSNNSILTCKPAVPIISGFSFFQQDGFYFIDPVPSELYLGDNINLGFFANQLVVSTYRYRLEVPIGQRTGINKGILNWSPWTKRKMTEISVIGLDIEGRYKFVIEYQTLTSGKVQSFTKYFYVFKKNPESAVKKSNNEIVPKATKPVASKNTADLTANRNNYQPVIKDSNTGPETERTDSRKISPKRIRTKVEALPKILIHTDDITLHPSIDTTIIKTNSYSNVSIRNMIEPDTLPDKGIAQNDTSKSSVTADIYGNTPLHRAILLGRNNYARSLIDQGADLNLINQTGLSPLHLAVFFNNEELANAMLDRGPSIDLQGNEGYTALHIAAELNHLEIARDLLQKGAKNRIKTQQNLTPKTIARIQGNRNMLKLIGRGNIELMKLGKSLPARIFAPLDSTQQDLKFNFTLPYSRDLAEKRQLNKLIQIVSIPVFVVSTTGAFFIRSEANRSFSLYKNAETEPAAIHYYDRTLKLDKLMYIPVTVSVASLYGFIHSTINKKIISEKMRKTF